MLITKRRVFLVLYVSIAFYFLLIWVYWSLSKAAEDAPVNEPVNHDRIQPRRETPSNPFRPQDGDVLVFFHIQKTGGTTFNSHLVQLDINPHCYCNKEPPEEGACRCRDSQGFTWLHSRFTASSTCGVHPPLADLSSCVPKFLSAAEGHDENTKKRYLYVTLLREPVQRYLSEWHHLQTIPPWPTDCRIKPNPVEECMKAVNSPMSLDDFIRCPGNPANNRMVRMLAMDSAELCDDLDQDGENILLKAKMALEKLAFFGLTERQKDTGKLFESTFGVKILSTFQQENNTTTHLRNTADGMLKLIQEANRLDIELYHFANSLFHNRLYGVKPTD